jgi:PhnB protein
LIFFTTQRRKLLRKSNAQHFGIAAKISSSLAEEMHMASEPATGASVSCSIAPWLSVRDGARAVEFYKKAFGATEVYRLDVPGGGVVARLSVRGSEFWLSGESSEPASSGPESVGGGSVRMILTVPDPDAVFAQALAAGAAEVFPVGEEHGWRLGRVVDPFGLHWEIGRPLVGQ